MKQNLKRAVNLTALVLAAGLLMGLLTGCPNGSGPNRPNESAQPNGPVQPTDPSIFKTDGHGVITGYTCTKDKLPANLVIPAKIGEEVITKISRAVFYECTGLTSVYFPASLTAIGVAAFEGCRGLTEVKLPANLTEIDSSAFKDCRKLKNIDLSGCTHLTAIGMGAFRDCKSLMSISLPASLTYIDNEAFWGCTDLTEVKLPANLTKIGCGAFIYCINLTSAVFANTNGWKVYEYGGGSYIGSISSSDLADASKAAEYLREEVSDGGYCDKYWEKN